MSFILDALKKAEQERGFGEVPGIDSLHDQPPRRRRRRWLWVVVAVLLLNALVLAALWWRGPGGTNDGTIPTAPPAGPVAESAPEPVSMPPPVSLPDRLPAAQTEGAGASAAQPNPPPEIARRPLRPLPLPDALPQPAPPKAEDLQATAPPAPAAATLAAPVVPRNVVELRPPSPPSPPQAEAAWKTLPLWPLVPDKISRQVKGRLVLNAHVFSEYPEDRFVLLNMRKYREGDQMSEGPYLEEITLDGVIFAVPNGRFRLKWRR